MRSVVLTLVLVALCIGIAGCGTSSGTDGGCCATCSHPAGACGDSLEGGIVGELDAGVAEGEAADVTANVCQGPVCGGACCSQYQTGCGIAADTGLQICCDTKQNFICGGSSACCPKQTSQCVLDTDPDSSFFYNYICESCQDAGCD